MAMANLAQALRQVASPLQFRAYSAHETIQNPFTVTISSGPSQGPLAMTSLHQRYGLRVSRSVIFSCAEITRRTYGARESSSEGAELRDLFPRRQWPHQ